MKHLPHIGKSKELIDGVFRTRNRIVCTVCREPHLFDFVPFDLAVKYLKNRSWRDPESPRKATCPACVEQEKEARMKAEDEKRPLTPKQKQAIWLKTNGPKGKSMNNAPQTPIKSLADIANGLKADPPRQATREDNRRITEALDIEYDLKAGCYLKSGSDAMVAKNLNMPVAWIATIRNQTYGENVNAEMLAAPKKLDEVVAVLKAVVNDSLAVAQRAEDAIKDVQKMKAALPAIAP